MSALFRPATVSPVARLSDYGAGLLGSLAPARGLLATVHDTSSLVRASTPVARMRSHLEATASTSTLTTLLTPIL